jgi:hypothetical protein
MKPKTWIEVRERLVYLRGYLSGWAAYSCQDGVTPAEMQREMDALSRLRPCGACHDGWMDSVGYPGYRHPCQICGGPGIAPEEG